jgi:hypothetical protein
MPFTSGAPRLANDKIAWIYVIFDYGLPRPSAGGPRRRNLVPVELVDCSFDRVAGAYVQAIRLKALALVYWRVSNIRFSGAARLDPSIEQGVPPAESRGISHGRKR